VVQEELVKHQLQEEMEVRVVVIFVELDLQEIHLLLVHLKEIMVVMV
jgi:hypothetical protein